MSADEATTPRRTWLAAERTFLAWWRTALAAAVAALAVGRLLPEVVDAAGWPFALLGLGYGAVAVGIFAAGAQRHRDVAAALAGEQPFRPLSRRLALTLSAAGALLTLATMALVAVEL